MDKPRQCTSLLSSAFGVEQRTYWRPAVDVYKLRTGWLLKFDLAGVAPEDVTVEVHGCRVIVAGVRRDWLVEEIDSYYSMEISYSRFERAVDLPCDFRNPHVTLEGREGILGVRIVEGS
jgi:HSP20 family molecular chaperone IbpA